LSTSDGVLGRDLAPPRRKSRSLRRLCWSKIQRIRPIGR
jgi:hypothetical protein